MAILKSEQVEIYHGDIATLTKSAPAIAGLTQLLFKYGWPSFRTLNGAVCFVLSSGEEIETAWFVFSLCREEQLR